MKTLEEAIGCWTTIEEYGSLPVLATSVLASAKKCRTITKRNRKPMSLQIELDLLLRRIDTLRECALSARSRIGEIIEKGECNEQ